MLRKNRERKTEKLLWISVSRWFFLLIVDTFENQLNAAKTGSSFVWVKILTFVYSLIFVEIPTSCCRSSLLYWPSNCSLRSFCIDRATCAIFLFFLSLCSQRELTSMIRTDRFLFSLHLFSLNSSNTNTFRMIYLFGCVFSRRICSFLCILFSLYSQFNLTIRFEIFCNWIHFFVVECFECSIYFTLKKYLSPQICVYLV